MYKVLDVSIQDDISQFSRLLWQHKISHRIVEMNDRQILTVPNQNQLVAASHLYQQWQRGDVSPLAQDSSDFVSYFSPGEFLRNFLLHFSRHPCHLV